jgi:hypothetical protein
VLTFGLIALAFGIVLCVLLISIFKLTVASVQALNKLGQRVNWLLSAQVDSKRNQHSLTNSPLRPPLIGFFAADTSQSQRGHRTSAELRTTLEI